MRIVITGGCGFLGRRVALGLLERRDVDELVLFDNAPSALPLPEDKRITLLTGDIADRTAVRAAIAPGTDAVYHLAAVVSGEAEADTDLGYRVNLDGTRAVLEACRALGTCPRLIFSSSLAVYGGQLPADVGDDTPLRPQTSYGTQKAIGELLVNDYSRKGFIDGRALRLPTVVVRPGRPNRAASTFASSMIREPLAGQAARRLTRGCAGSPMRRSRRSSRAGRRPWRRHAPRRSASAATGASTKSSRRSSRTTCRRKSSWLFDAFPRSPDGRLALAGLRITPRGSILP